MKLRKVFHRVLAKLNLEIKSLNPATNNSLQISRFINQNDFDLVLDIGANEGQFVQALFDSGYAGKAVSFEPLPQQHEILSHIVAGNVNWTAAPRMAIGSVASNSTINISGMHASSSLRPMSAIHTDAFSGSSTIAEVSTQIVPLDEVASEYLLPESKLFIKIDTQGYEKEVLLGAMKTLSLTSAVLVEVSTVELYEGQALMDAILSFMASLKFKPFIFQQCTVHPHTLQTLQLDILFIRG